FFVFFFCCGGVCVVGVGFGGVVCEVVFLGVVVGVGGVVGCLLWCLWCCWWWWWGFWGSGCLWCVCVWGGCGVSAWAGGDCVWCVGWLVGACVGVVGGWGFGGGGSGLVGVF
ncbi:hypothetical protein, partial [Pseudomonas syringae group genomosp. 7]|uniref:hypothetical protein n=1 Tax=Pseudomonas syringae group genomosp. 7 TaxID=251699 RepID=UPI00376F89C2